jgi:hypothetical protein
MTRKRTTWVWSLAGVVAVAVAALVAQAGCSTQAAGVNCTPGSTVMCSCQGALTGQAQCDSSGHESACNCTGGGSSSGGGSGGSSGGASGGSSGGSSGSSSGGVPAEGGSGGGDGGEVGDGATGG